MYSLDECEKQEMHRFHNGLDSIFSFFNTSITLSLLNPAIVSSIIVRVVSQRLHKYLEPHS